MTETKKQGKKGGRQTEKRLAFRAVLHSTVRTVHFNFFFYDFFFPAPNNFSLPKI